MHSFKCAYLFIVYNALNIPHLSLRETKQSRLARGDCFVPRNDSNLICYILNDSAAESPIDKFFTPN